MKDSELFAIPEEKQAMLKLCKKWSNKDSLNRQFWGLGLWHADGKPDLSAISRELTEERLRNAVQCLQDWLKQRRDGKLD